MSDDKLADDERDAPKKSGGPGKLLLIVVLVNMLISGAAMAVTLLKSGGDHGKKEEGEKKEEHGEEKKAEAAPAAPAGEHGAAPAAPGAPAAAGAPGAPGALGGPLVRVEDIVVHLRNPEVDRYVRLALDIELATPQDLAAFQGAMPKVRDIIIGTLADRTYEQIAGADGMTRLKTELLEGCASVSKPATLKAIYFTEFVVQ